jgi:outer membrane protein OmpA-like peptidoglycan-associated protein
MSSQSDDNQGLVLGVVFGAVVLVLALVAGLTVFKRGPVPQAPADQASATAVTAATDAGVNAASVKVENGVVKFYFESAKADVASGAKEALADVVAAVASGKKAVISGFHDASGDAAKNAELAKQRAMAVRDALQGLGVGVDKIELKKPEETTAGGPAELARRVEVSVQ